MWDKTILNDSPAAIVYDMTCLSSPILIFHHVSVVSNLEIGSSAANNHRGVIPDIQRWLFQDPGNIWVFAHFLNIHSCAIGRETFESGLMITIWADRFSGC